MSGGLCVVVGAGAQGRVTQEIWQAARPDAAFAFVDDDASLHGKRVADVEVVGALDHVVELVAEGAEIVLAIGNPVARAAVAHRFTKAGPIRWGRAIHPSAVVMRSASVGPGSVIFAGSVVNTAAAIGEHVIVNTGVVVEHDAVVADYVNLSPGVRSGGRVAIGAGAFVGTGVTLAPRVRIGAGAIVGAGAVVLRDVPDRTLAFGVPARVVRAVDASFDWKRLL